MNEDEVTFMAIKEEKENFRDITGQSDILKEPVSCNDYVKEEEEIFLASIKEEEEEEDGNCLDITGQESNLGDPLSINKGNFNIKSQLEY